MWWDQSFVYILLMIVIVTGLLLFGYFAIRLLCRYFFAYRPPRQLRFTEEEQEQVGMLKTHQVCHLCLEKISLEDWQGGAHRRACTEEYDGFLEQLSSPFDYGCPKCGKKLKLWPKRQSEEVFVCSLGFADLCNGKRIENDGANRLCCFICDQNSCIDCVERQQQVPKDMKCLLAAERRYKRWEMQEELRVAAVRNKNDWRVFKELSTPFLQEMGTSPSCCPFCGERLRIVPKSREMFVCYVRSSDECHGRPKENTGENRLRCSRCDYEICDPCRRTDVFAQLGRATKHQVLKMQIQRADPNYREPSLAEKRQRALQFLTQDPRSRAAEARAAGTVQDMATFFV